jgi:hypothetical protein
MHMRWPFSCLVDHVPQCIIVTTQPLERRHIAAKPFEQFLRGSALLACSLLAKYQCFAVSL